MFRRYARCTGIVLLGLLTWVPMVSAEGAALENGVLVGAEEDGYVEHAKINTADASMVDPGHFEIESSYAYAHSKRFFDNDSHAHARGLARQQSLGLAITAGVIEHVDMTVGGSYVWIKDEENDFDENDAILGPGKGQSFGDLNISGRYRFFESKEHSLELAYIGGFTIPTGSSSSSEEIGTGQEFWSFNQTLVANKDWGKWTANVDVGYALPLGDKRGDERGTFNADVAVGYQLLSWLQPEIELNFGRNFHAIENDAEVLALTAGLVMPINGQLRVTTGVQQCLSGRNTDKATSLFAAVSLAF